MLIRTATPSGAAAISGLILTTLQAVNTEDYTERQMAELKKIHSPKQVAERLADPETLTVVATEDKQIIGTGSLKNNEISAIYVESNRIGQGIGSAIMAHLEEDARKKGIKTITVASSPTAVNFYKKHGYRLSKKAGCCKVGGGMPCVSMKKTLT